MENFVKYLLGHYHTMVVVNDYGVSDLRVGDIVTGEYDDDGGHYFMVLTRNGEKQNEWYSSERFEKMTPITQEFKVDCEEVEMFP